MKLFGFERLVILRPADCDGIAPVGNGLEGCRAVIAGQNRAAFGKGACFVDMDLDVVNVCPGLIPENQAVNHQPCLPG